VRGGKLAAPNLEAVSAHSAAQSLDVAAITRSVFSGGRLEVNDILATRTPV
jgi:hypothetical protein